RRWLPRMIGLAAVAAAAGAAAWTALSPHDSGLALLVAAGALIVAGAAWFELGAQSTKLLVVVATLGGVAAMGRVLFRLVPGVQPPRLRLQRRHGPLGVVRLLPAHLGGADRPARPRRLVRRRARVREPRARARRRAGAPAPAGAVRAPPADRGRLGVIAFLAAA